MFRDEINYEPLKQISRLLKNLLISSEAEVSKGNLIQKLAYGRKEHVINAMCKAKLCDLLFSFASSASDRTIFRTSDSNVSSIFEDIFCIIATIFDGFDVSQLFSCLTNNKMKNILEDQKIVKKPIRHGRFSGSVSVQLSVKILY